MKTDQQRYKIVPYHPSLCVYEKMFADAMAEARRLADELMHTKLAIIKPKGINILRRRKLRRKGVTYTDWVPVATIGSVPA